MNLDIGLQMLAEDYPEDDTLQQEIAMILRFRESYRIHQEQARVTDKAVRQIAAFNQRSRRGARTGYA